ECTNPEGGDILQGHSLKPFACLLLADIPHQLYDQQFGSEISFPWALLPGDFLDIIPDDVDGSAIAKVILERLPLAGHCSGDRVVLVGPDFNSMSITDQALCDLFSGQYRQLHAWEVIPPSDQQYLRCLCAGRRYVLINHTKRELMHPHCFGDYSLDDMLINHN